MQGLNPIKPHSAHYDTSDVEGRVYLWLTSVLSPLRSVVPPFLGR